MALRGECWLLQSHRTRQSAPLWAVLSRQGVCALTLEQDQQSEESRQAVPSSCHVPGSGLRWA